MEQKIPVKKVEIQIYGAKRALERPRQGSSDEALLSTLRAEAAAPSNPRPSYDQYMSFGLRGSLQTAQKYPLSTILSRFGRIWGACDIGHTWHWTPNLVLSERYGPIKRPELELGGSIDSS